MTPVEIARDTLELAQRIRRSESQAYHDQLVLSVWLPRAEALCRAVLDAEAYRARAEVVAKEIRKRAHRVPYHDVRTFLEWAAQLTENSNESG